jgi:PAS domain S-box-containing protein
MEFNKTQLIESVFAGGGEMAALMRAFDWSTTPLGPVEQWPQALRICARIVLGSGYPMSICWGPHYVMLYNDAFRPAMGAKHPWALGRSCCEVFPEAWGFMGPLHERIMTRGQETSFLTSQLVSLNRNNYLEECYFAFSYGPIPDDHGHVGGVLGTGLETTERVLEDRRRQVLRDLASRTVGARNEEEVWRVSAETLGEHRLSIPFAFLYEYRPAERQAHLAGTSVETDESLHPTVVDCDSENLWRLDPALTRDGVVVELGNRASGLSVPNWPDRPKQACVVPIRLGEYSEALGFLVAGIHPGRAFDDAYRQFILRTNEQITIGLTSARAYNQERQRADALAELDRAKTAFFSNVSHEFRTPLTLMLGPLEEVLPEALERLRPEHHEQLVTVRRNALRLLKLVNTLLDFSRIEAGRVRASYQPTDLATFTTEIASAFDSAMENAGLRFSVECQPIAEPVYVDRDMWEKIVLNLLSNALKFTFEGEVALALKPVDGAVQLQVRDTGVGIPEEHRERVFERFHRFEGRQARTYEGSGIGLALVQELVKLHDGSVRVESALRQGSTFTVTIATGKEHLPAERIQAEQKFASSKIRAEAYVEEARQWLGEESGAAVDVPMLREPPLPNSLPQPKPGARRELIVLADDNADMRQHLIRLLSDRYEVHAVADGRQALEATRKLRPALVLTDIMMPHLDGSGLLRAIRDDAALAGTPVILLSARAGEESRVEGLEADADDYLIKPFAARELLARVATHVKMANLRRETAEREERLRSEAELEREKLRTSEERLAETSRLYRELQRAEAELQIQVGLLQLLPVSAWTLKPDGTPDFVNRVWLEFSGQTLDFVRSHPEAWMTAIHPEDREIAAKKFWEGVHTGQDFATETRSLRAEDGTYRWLLNQAVVLRDAEGKVLKFVGTTTDIDDQKRAEEELRNAQSELGRVTRVMMMGQLTASIAHEINQPLSGILTNLSTCQRMLSATPPNVEGALETARRAIRDINRASDVIKRLRALFSRGVTTSEPVDLNEVAEEVVALLMDELQRNQVVVRSEFAKDLPLVMGDRVQLQQVVLNLLRNGSDAMISVDDRPRHLIIKTERGDGQGVRLSVKDVGVGFEPQAEGKLFEGFYTTKKDGMGIGLSISKSIIESHHGRLWAERNEGGGATFSFSIPCASEKNVEDGAGCPTTSMKSEEDAA